jgi:PEP-CTERM motif
VFEGINDIAAWNLDDVSLNPVAAAVPEPASLLLLAIALAALASTGRSARFVP